MALEHDRRALEHPDRDAGREKASPSQAQKRNKTIKEKALTAAESISAAVIFIHFLREKRIKVANKAAKNSEIYQSGIFQIFRFGMLKRERKGKTRCAD
jgi:hypothetical protein